MKDVMKAMIRYISVVCVLCMMIQPVLADECVELPPCLGYGDDDPGVNCCVVIEVPFDGGLTLMLAAGGIGMGVKAMKRKKKE